MHICDQQQSFLISRQPKFEAVLAEITTATNELYFAINNLSSWMKPEYVSKNLVGGCSSRSRLLQRRCHVFIIWVWFRPLNWTPVSSEENLWGSC